MMKNNGLFLKSAPIAIRQPARFGGIIAAAVALQALPIATRADTYAFAVAAGAGSALDHTDGTGTNARFFNPNGAAMDGAGNIYLADTGDHTVREVTAGGVVTTLAGTSGQPGSADGTGPNALFLYPYAVAVDSGGNVFVTDIGNQNIRKIAPGGAVSTVAGTLGVVGSLDGSALAARFNFPEGIAVDAAGNVYISDTNNGTIRRLSATGTVTTLAGTAGLNGAVDGAGGAAKFNNPAGLGIDSAGNLYLADYGNSTVRKITSGGAVTTLAGLAAQTGTSDGQGSAARFNHPSAVALDGAGNIYVIDTSNQTVRKVSAGGNVSTLAGTPGVGGRADGAGAAASFFYPGGIAATGSGTVYVADTGNHALRVVTPSGAVATLAGSAGLAGSTDGTGSAALFNYPDGVAVDSSGNLYIADHGNDTIRKLTAGGVATTVAGAAGLSGSADGGGGAARFNGPTGVAVDPSGNLYVADAGNSTIRKITAAGAVSTLAGLAGVAGNSDGAGAAARFNAPQGIAVDSAGNVYVADTNNSTIRKVTAAGTVTTLAGVAGQSAAIDGLGGAARFDGPYAVAVDSSGNVYVADFFNATIRKITSGGAVTTLAGLAPLAGFTDATGPAAKFNQTYGLAVDAGGNVFVSDTYNRAVRKITAGGTVTTIEGPQSRFFYPQGIAVDGAENLYVADGDNQAIDVGVFVAPPPSGTQVSSVSVLTGQSATFSIGPGNALTTYQWQVSTNGGVTWIAVANDADDSGATTATLVVSNVTLAMTGNSYRLLLADAAGTGVSGAAALTVASPLVLTGPTGTARLTNLSIRSYAGTGANTLTVGIVIGGSGPMQALVRGIGPTLASSFSVAGALTSTQLSIFNAASVLLSSNSGWGGSAALAGDFAAVGAFPLPAGSADSALFQSLPGGDTSYTAQISGLSGATGIALAEVYDADTGTPTARLVNLSARALSGAGSSILTAGFILGGSGTDTLLIRGIGPTLAQYGVTGFLAAPQVTLFNAAGQAIASNTGWGGGPALTAAFLQVGAFALPAGSADSALLVTVTPGTYTVQVGGVNGTTGIGLVEIYELQ
jgi:sugar lactone lactonase YvrE